MAAGADRIYSDEVKLVPSNDQLRELQTIVRDSNTTPSDFVFYADRLIRLVVEEGLNQLPHNKITVTTPSGHMYEGVDFSKGNCGVSICRSGESMEKALRECCRAIRIGKVLLDHNEDRRLLYARLLPDMAKKTILLLYPIMPNGTTVTKAINVLKENGAVESKLVLLNLFCTSYAVNALSQTFPDMTIVTSEIHPSVPTHFGTKYFGTD